jgi:polyribonucleotide nucleotidyltransferase
MSIHNVTIDLGNGNPITVETGKMALLAGGSVTVRQGDTIVLVAACSSAPRPGLDFFPLQVDYREKFSAAGRLPGGYFKREGRPTEKEILTARMTDRPLRPLFPKGFIDDVQIMASLLSADGENEADVLSMLGASAALMLSDIPFQGPVGSLRVGRVDGEFVANPTHSQLEKSDLDLVYAGIPGKTIMIEGSADEVSEEVLRDALAFADAAVVKLAEAQKELLEKRGAKPAKDYTPRLVPDDLLKAAEDACRGKIESACFLPDKLERQKALGEVYDQMVDALAPTFEADGADETPNYKGAFDEVTEKTVRRLVLEQGKRMDGRGVDDLREITCEVGLLPRVHGSALFKRGDTQALVTITLGAESDAQEYDVITGGEAKRRFFLHYNFPNFSVGETGRIMGPGRREIGHGALAERSVTGVVPEDFGYTIRCVSDILGSNGSSSMASVCGASLALMDAGVPVSDSVVGISVGLITGDEDQKTLLVDILGSEDHFGDMDFKVSGTTKGITGFQLDLKIPGLDIDTMLKNREARQKIRAVMNECIAEPRAELSPFAPQMIAMKINPERIGALIGPGGKIIRGIVESTGAQIDVEDDGTVKIFAVNAESLEAARREVEAVAAEVEIGRIYKGLVKTVKDFGAFVEVLPGQEGLVHISELADYRVKNVEEICNVGDEITVKVIDIDDRGRIRLSRKAALAEI